MADKPNRLSMEGQDFTRGDEYNTRNLEDKLTSWEGFQAAESVFRYNTLTELKREKSLNRQWESQDIRSPEDLNAEFPDMEMPFKKPTPYFVAQSIAERAREKAKLRWLQTHSPDGTLDWIAQNLVAPAFAHSTDPIEMGIGILGGMATAAAAPFALGALGYSAAASSLAAGTAGIGARLGVGFVGSLIGEGMTEMLIMQESRAMQERYTVEEAVINTIGTATIGTLLGMGFKAGKSLFNDVNNGKFGTKMKSAFAQDFSGKRINVETDPDFTRYPGGDSPRIGVFDTGPETRYDSGVRSKGKVFESGARGTFSKGDELFAATRDTFDRPTMSGATISRFGFEGEVHLSDNFKHTTERVLNSGGDEGSVFTVRLNDDINLMDMDTPIAKQNSGVFEDLKRVLAHEKVGLKVDENTSLKDVFDELKLEHYELAERVVKASSLKNGVDGLTQNSGRGSNNLTIFNESKIDQVKRSNVTQDMIESAADPDAVKADAASRTEDVYSDPQDTPDYNARESRMKAQESGIEDIKVEDLDLPKFEEGSQADMVIKDAIKRSNEFLETLEEAMGFCKRT